MTPAHHPAGERQLLQVPSREASSPSSGRRPGKSSSPSPGTGPLPQRLRLPAQSCGVQASPAPSPQPAPFPELLSPSSLFRVPEGEPASPTEGFLPPLGKGAAVTQRSQQERPAEPAAPTLRSRGLGGALSSAWAQVGVRVGEQGPFPQRNMKTLLPGPPRCCRPTPSGARKRSVSGQ